MQAPRKSNTGTFSYTKSTNSCPSPVIPIRYTVPSQAGSSDAKSVQDDDSDSEILRIKRRSSVKLEKKYADVVDSSLFGYQVCSNGSRFYVILACEHELLDDYFSFSTHLVPLIVSLYV